MFKAKKLKYKPFFLAFILIIIVVIFIFFISSKNYILTYNIKDFTITEGYDKKSHLYQFIIKYNDKEFPIKIPQKFVYKKKLIKNIEIKENSDLICLIPESKKINFYPLCYQNNELISYHQINNKDLIPTKYYPKIKSNPDNYNKININYLNNKKYYIWNYKGFYFIDGKKNKTINIFDEDIYNIPLAAKSQDYILIGDYKSKYKFHKFYILQTKKNKIKELNTDKELSFESYILGNYKNKIYLMDKKNQKEYEIDLKKLILNNITRKNKGKILTNNEWQEISITKLINNEYKFNNEIFNYQIKENKLYLIQDQYQTLISNLNIKDIVSIDKDTVYYLVDDKLYAYNPYQGEILIMSYFEWNFNYKNMIFIF